MGPPTPTVLRLAGATWVTAHSQDNCPAGETRENGQSSQLVVRSAGSDRRFCHLVRDDQDRYRLGHESVILSGLKSHRDGLMYSQATVNVTSTPERTDVSSAVRQRQH